MTVAEYLVEFLAERGVTEVFGIPGGVVLDFLYAISENDKITSYLSYHEQAAAFEACGYAQVEHRLGCAYATKGPGFTNMITGIADAYADSIPVMFISAHGESNNESGMRFEQAQELDTISMIKKITKYAKKIDNSNEVISIINEAYKYAMSGRKGPVFLDFSEKMWSYEISNVLLKNKIVEQKSYVFDSTEVIQLISSAKKPVFLIGDGVRQANAIKELESFVSNYKIPIISSRCGQDVFSGKPNYFGYIGSHGIRYANYILENADLIISLGNRLAFPTKSESYKKTLKGKLIIRVDIDETELLDRIDKSVEIVVDLKHFLRNIALSTIHNREHANWLAICNRIKNLLINEDTNETVNLLANFFSDISDEVVLVCDVGNNEFWVSRAYELSGIQNRILYSKSFGALGSSIGKAIGAYFVNKKPILCIVGDQGFQINSQELQFIKQYQLPIVILVLNNEASGMIKDREERKHFPKYIHVTKDTGYFMVDLKKVAHCFDIKFHSFIEKIDDIEVLFKKPTIIEMRVDPKLSLEPNLPRGNSLFNLSPPLDTQLYMKIDRLGNQL